MKKHLGISRNRHDRLTAIKKDSLRKKNRFHLVGKEDELDTGCNLLYYIALTSVTTNSEGRSSYDLTDRSEEESFLAIPLFKEARGHLQKAT
jgi:hypothetical protein